MRPVTGGEKTGMASDKT